MMVRKGVAAAAKRGESEERLVNAAINEELTQTHTKHNTVSGKSLKIPKCLDTPNAISDSRA